MSTVESTSAWAQTLSSISSALHTHMQEKTLNKMDTDGSGGADQTEFKAALEKLAGKLGVEVGEGSEELFASLDADQDGALNGTEVGQLLQNLFTPPSDTQAFVQSRGDEARFAELDTDSDGNISMAEFGISSDTGLSEGSVVSSTTTTTVVGAAEDAASMVASYDAAAASGLVATSGETAEGATEVAAASQTTEGVKGLMKNVDKDGDGEISGAELTAFMNRVNAHAEAATRRYNETALASNSTSSGNLNEAV